MIFFLSSLLLIILVPEISIAMETGYGVNYDQNARLHSDTNSVGSKTISLNHQLFVSLDFLERFSLRYEAKQTDWSLVHPDGTKYINLVYNFQKPIIRYKTEQWQLKASFLLMDIVRNEELYSPIDEDETDQFLLPEIFAEYFLSDITFEIGGWLEKDIQTFDYYRYSIFAYQTAVAGVGYNLSEQHAFKLNVYRYDRIYPPEYDLSKDEYVVLYRFLKPYTYEDRFEWRELSLKYEETHFPSEILTEFKITNYLKFKLINLTHFFTYGLSITNYHTTYKEGLWAYSLIEEDNMEEDLIHSIEYAGFTRISSSRFFLSWKYTLEDSLTRNAFLDQSVKLQLTYNFE